MSSSSKHRAPRSARNPLLKKRLNGWVVAYAAVVFVTAGAVSTYRATTEAAPEASAMAFTPSQAPVATGALLQASLAAQAPEAAESGFMTASAAIAPIDELFGQHWFDRLSADRKVAAVAAPSDRFDAVVKQAALSPTKLATLIERATPDKKRIARPAKIVATKPISAVMAAAAIPSADEVVEAEAPVVLAYASPAPAVSNDALAAVSAMAIAPDRTKASDILKTEPALGADAAVEDNGLPETVMLPAPRPEVDEATKKLLRVEKPKAEKAKEETKLAFAKPENPAGEESSGFGLKNFFGRPKAGNGVAVYDISAARVYMPDGTVLEAHSGIGKMADNPKYVHVKMSGPTPPHTYNLKMREKRFHGVEAIRMLPVDGKNKHGRDGFLTHSYLLRGGRAESHGCVAFKDYDKFLKAFKAGKVKQLVVVAGGGKGISKKRNTVIEASAGGSGA